MFKRESGDQTLMRDARSATRAALLVLLAVASECAAQGSPACGAGDPGAVLARALRLEQQGARSAATSCYRAALAALPPGDRVRRINARSGLARLAEAQGALEEARTQLSSALSEAEADPSLDSNRAADVLDQLGWVEYQLGRYPDAERTLQRALSTYERMLGPYPIEVTKVLNELGAVYRERGDYDRAEGVLTQALANLDRADADDRAQRAAVYNNLAGVAYDRNDYQRAIELYRRAASLFEELYGESRIEVARAVNNLGLLYYEVGEYEHAQSQLERALRLNTRLQGAQSAAVGDTLSNLAEVEAARGDQRSARSYFARAERVLSQSLGRSHPQVATVLLNWGITLADAGDEAGARPVLERALAIRTRASGADSKPVAETLNALGPVWNALGERRKAAGAARRALAIAATVDEQELTWSTYRAYARVLANQGQLSDAAFYGKYAVNVLQAMRNDLALRGKQLPASVLLRRQSAYRELADVLISLGRLTDAQQVIAMLKEEEFFGFAGLARVAPGSPVRAGFSADEGREADRLDAAVLALRTSAREDRAESDKESGERPAATRYRRERATFEKVVRSVDDALAPTTRDRASSTSPHADTHVDAHTAALTYLLTADHVRLIVQVGGAFETYSLAVAPTALNKMIVDFRQALQNPESDPLPAAQELYHALLQPAEARLAGAPVEALQLVLDGPLRYLPFGALHDGHRFLVERFRIGLRTSLELARQPDVAREQERLAGFGAARAVEGFPALPRVQNELDNIVRTDRGDSHGFIRGVVALDQDFTSEQLRRTLEEGYPLVHIASHLVVRPGRLSESYLVLGDGSRLTLEQMKTGALSFRDVRLLTLSACSTAVGESDATGAEFEGFGVLAGRLGAHQVLATLWSVADNNTAALMTSFYRLRQQGQSTVAALAQAQRTMLNAGDRHGPYSHPHYWAPLVVFLNDRAS